MHQGLRNFFLYTKILRSDIAVTGVKEWFQYIYLNDASKPKGTEEVDVMSVSMKTSKYKHNCFQINSCWLP